MSPPWPLSFLSYLTVLSFGKDMTKQVEDRRTNNRTKTRHCTQSVHATNLCTYCNYFSWDGVLTGMNLATVTTA